MAADEVTNDKDRWNARYRRRGPRERTVEPWVMQQVATCLRPGRALDVAGGDGRHALALAALGWRVTLLDVSDEALSIAVGHARKRNLRLKTMQHDVLLDGWPKRLHGTNDLVLCHHFHPGPRLSDAWRLLAPGGKLMFVQPTVINLERHARPSRRVLIELGHAQADLRKHLLLDVVEEGWNETGRHEIRVTAFRPAK